jgi:hypothetical protein
MKSLHELSMKAKLIKRDVDDMHDWFACYRGAVLINPDYPNWMVGGLEESMQDMYEMTKRRLQERTCELETIEMQIANAQITNAGVSC